MSATKYQEMTDNSVLLISAVDLSGPRQDGHGRFATLTDNFNQHDGMLHGETGPSGKRIQLRTSGTGNATKIQINKESSFAASNQVRVYWIKGQKGDTGEAGTDGTDGIDTILYL